ncbi:MAG: S24/S26 family peptidase [Desulfobacterales bacterium]|nr:S24/S26 family peptidase [Desulfobacterales bacterium]
MKPHRPEPALLLKKGELSLSGPALKDLMQAVLRKHVPFRFRASGFSMAPFIKDGDVLTVFPVIDSPPGIGDVAAFSHPAGGRLAVHRIVAQNKSGYRLKGDGADDADGMVSQANIIGIVRKVERNGHRVLLGLGPEKILIAFLSVTGLLSHLLRPLWLFFKTLRGVR